MSESIDGSRAGEDAGASAMPADFIQASRVLKLTSPLGEDVLLPERATITEAVSELFTIEISVRAKRDQVKPAELIGRLVDLGLEVEQGGEGGSALRRPFNGLVTNLDEGPPITRGLRSYRLTLRPQLWLLSRRSDCRIFMDRTSLDICEMLLSEHGLPPADLSDVILKPAPQHYSVQWNETDLDYLLRRFEEDGLFFWFEHEEGRHRMIVGDHQSAWRQASAAARGDAAVRLAQGSSDRNHINDWSRSFSYIPGSRAGADWNFETPGTVPRAATPSMIELPDAQKRELYEYPSRAADVAANERAERLRMQASEADHERVEGASNVRVLEPGRRFKPYEVAHPDLPHEEHVILKAVHRIVDRSYEAATDEPEYRNSFQAAPSRIPMTPHRGTHRPRIAGAQVGIVAGPSGEEIHCDPYGRIKLWFPWDRRAKKDGSDTCWIRVSQAWAGGTWGAQVIPRIGMEAMVAFVDGDPDRPLIVSLVPNPANAVPYTLPSNRTKSVLRSNTHKGTGYNEISLEDEAGREELFLHAQKDMATRVLNDKVKRIDRHDVESIGGNRNVEIQQNKQEKVHGSVTETVGGAGGPLLAAIGHVAAVGGRDSLDGSSGIGNDMVNQFAAAVAAVGGVSEAAAMAANGLFAKAGNHRSEAGGEQTHHGSAAGGLLSQLMPMSGIVNSVVEKFRSDTIGMARTEQIGVYKNTSVGHTMTINVGQEFIIKCGDSMLVMDKEGNVTITGTKFNFSATGPVQINGKVIDLN